MKHIQHPDGTVELLPNDPAESLPAIEPSDPAALREQAYRAQADQYLTAYMGYLTEGRTAEAEAQKALYLEAKAQIRGEYPDTND